MKIERKEYEKEKEAIIAEVEEVFHNRMRIFTWDVPENDALVAAEFIIKAMQEAIDRLKKEKKGQS
ncbi:hypothetical protein JWV37_08385 [Sulfurospirillum sp. T05]|uniref:Uncharacterized protein n=1 Tax=Sulfurospirillum tamanense TaxID=2813362 RepID=A0ABS2WT05_9BACT|nr:hypothetical protein [Sulfurospirillum tamanensis]MBN2964797.1 hypothetical protein [Sulfurospirillum tamanensis]